MKGLITVQLQKGDRLYLDRLVVYEAKRDVLLRIDEFNVGMKPALDLLEGSQDPDSEKEGEQK